MQRTARLFQAGLCRTSSSACLFGSSKLRPLASAKFLSSRGQCGRSRSCFVAAVRTPSTAVLTVDGKAIAEFVGSTPAIEQTVRSFVRDLTTSKYTSRLFAADVEYKDGVRFFKGVAKYQRQTWVASYIDKPVVSITEVVMQDKGTAKVCWELNGVLSGQAVLVRFVTNIEMNLLTGRIIKHSESWDLKGCSPSAAAAVTGSRLAWSARQALQDASDSMSQSLDSISGSMDEDSSNINFNPTDPTRFFQNQENPMKDYLTLTTVVAFMYFVYHAFEAIEKLP